MKMFVLLKSRFTRTEVKEMALKESSNAKITGKTYKVYTVSNFKKIPQLKLLSDEQLLDIEIVGNVLPFKVNNYAIDELIDWDNIPNDPLFILTFPQKGMLLPHHYSEVKSLIIGKANRDELRNTVNRIRMELNPHPAGQLDRNVPMIDDIKLTGMQHKYRETVLFFPSHGQTCHAYCTYCFRWPQFIGMDDIKFSMKETERLIKYLKKHPEVTDILFTGGDPLVMKTKVLKRYLEPLLESDLHSLRNIRIGTKALSYWPYRFTTDIDAKELLELFENIKKAEKHLAIMANFNHPRELETDAVKEAINKIRATGAQIRTQSPVLRHINDSPDVWADMWNMQVHQGCIPYYMFIARNTGAQHYFAISLIRAWEIFRKAYQKVSGICRTVRGPVMSCNPGKVQILGVGNISDEKVMTLRMIQGRNPDWVARPFFAEYNEDAIWFTDLKPAFNEEKFFFEDELEKMFHTHIDEDESGEFE
jgi:KamA family protein